MEEIKVSIICNAYNHGKYIKDALDGFLMQKTNFPFEVLIHDDASTDNTAEIIREYEKQYPDIIKPIYQKENQYSKGISIGLKYQVPRMKGKYIALCEGDDYWTDSLKLQKQFDAMEKYPEIDICAHAATKIKAVDGKKICNIAPARSNTIFSPEKVILGGGGFVATNSLFYRKELAINVPEFRKFLSLDYTLQIHGALRGGMLYLPYNMSVYRAFVAGSWTDRMKNRELSLKHLEKIIKMLDVLDKETENKFSKAIRQHKLEIIFNDIADNGEYDRLRKGDLKDIYNAKPLPWKLKIYIKEYFPTLLSLYRKMR